MKSRAYRLLLLIAVCTRVSTDFQDKTENDFLQASERCFRRERLAVSYKRYFDNFEYPDEEAVHRYVHCIWTVLSLWNDRTGFNVEHIATLYRNRANTEVLIPILSDCNSNTRNEPPLKWCYMAFKCVLNSRVGQWFKEDVGKKLRGEQNHVG